MRNIDTVITQMLDVIPRRKIILRRELKDIISDKHWNRAPEVNWELAQEIVNTYIPHDIESILAKNWIRQALSIWMGCSEKELVQNI